MSEIRSIPIPIKQPIKYSKSWHSFSDPNNQIQNYLFELIINLNNNENKRIIRLESDKHCNLIFIKDKIEYKNLLNFKVSVKKIPSDYSFNYEMEGIISNDQSSYSQQDCNLHIEFSQNSNGYTICNCSFIGIDFNTICVSPPN
jgi:hypothetical protein